MGDPVPLYKTEIKPISPIRPIPFGLSIPVIGKKQLVDLLNLLTVSRSMEEKHESLV
jgi:hypothetical protein